MIKAVLFDLDGTLLPMDNDVFTKGYFGLLAKKLAPLGYEPKKLVEGIMYALKAMVESTDDSTNEEVFWNAFSQLHPDAKKDIPVFEEFYQNEFNQAKDLCGCNPLAKKAVELIKDKGLRVTLATNPIFPAIATKQRISWAGFEEEDFEFYTTYENSCYAKPQVKYYQEVCTKMGLQVEECLMVGNDALEDMIASKLGMQVFLLTDCLINKTNEDINKYPRGSFEDLISYIEAL